MMFKKIFVFTSLFIMGIVTARSASPVIDGVLDSSAGYKPLTDTTMGPGARTGFGSNVDCSQIWMTSDASSVYFFIQGKVMNDDSSANGIVFLISASNLTGASAGATLGNVPGGTGIFGNTGSNSWAMDFPVAKAFEGDPGPATTGQFFVNYANYVGTDTGYFLFNIGQGGTAFSNSTVGCRMAFYNAGNSTGPGISSGWEMALDRTKFFNGIASSDTIEVYAIIATPGNAYFSNDAAPETFYINAGQNFDFQDHHTPAVTIGSITTANSPKIDGTLDTGHGYVLLSTDSSTPGARTGFGTAEDCSQIWATADVNSVYFFVQGKVPVTSGGNADGIVFLLNCSNLGGATVGQSLGNVPHPAGQGGIFSDTGNDNWNMDFAVSLAWEGDVSADSGASNHFYINYANYGSNTSFYLFDVLQSGTTLSNLTGGTHAFLNTGNSGGLGNSTGWEFAVSRASLGNIQNTDTISAYAIIANTGNGYFSDDAAPVVQTGNPGYNPPFSDALGNQHTTPVAVGGTVDISDFTNY